jgi:ribonuclease T2
MTGRLRLPHGGRLLLLAGLLLFSACEQQAGTPPAEPSASREETSTASAKVPLGTGFDFYVLSLSWSPSYCEAEGKDANRQQCSAGRPYAFVVHGLWPQFERGYPENCGGKREVDRERLRGLYDIIPSAGLIRHEWRTHGTCSGLSQEEYFRVVRQARERVVIPPEFRRLEDYRSLAPGAAEASFLKANPGLEPEDMAVTCDNRFLREVHICMTKQLEFRACPEVDRRACRADKVVMPPVRGGSGQRS